MLRDNIPEIRGWGDKKNSRSPIPGKPLERVKRSAQAIVLAGLSAPP